MGVRRNVEPTGRRTGAGSWAAACLVIVVFAGVMFAVSRGSDDTPGRLSAASGERTSTTLTREPSSGAEGWETMAPSPLTPRSDGVAVWTGKEMLVWRGQGAFTDTCGRSDSGELLCGEPVRNDGAAYNPTSNSWRSLPEAPLAPVQGSELGYAGVWTGRELVVWGGLEAQGAAYDPEGDAWRVLPDAGLAPRSSFSMTWTGREVIVHGGRVNDDPGVLLRPDPVDLRDGAAYDPITNRWRSISDSETSRAGHSAVWSGERLIVLGGAYDDAQPVPSIQSYEPESDTWEALADAPFGYVWGAVWTGTDVVAVGVVANFVEETRNAASASYDPGIDEWTEHASPSVEQLVTPTVLWTGREVVVLGAPFGDGSPSNRTRGVAFDPEDRAWRVLPEPPLSSRGGMASVWTGIELLAWGGANRTGFTSEPHNDGARYRPGDGR